MNSTLTQSCHLRPESRPPRFEVAPSEDAVARHRILCAAREVLERSNFRSLKIRQVLAASGISARRFYCLFPSKGHLLLALLTDEVRAANARLRRTLRTAPTASQQLRGWVAFTIAHGYDASRAERLRMFRSPELLDELPEQTRSVHRVLNRQLADILARGMRDHEFRPGNPEADAIMVQYLVRGVLDDLLLAPLPHAEEEIVSATYAFVLNALRPG
ncbi:TetR/AcrR family transcriptional regulator [Nocardia sp. BSTN01]|uniref:TetR/AcrR family transcriptional regulator n=1 Tax=Nocardia sp. BSTN01 TaxID=2783665 RepID=UPI00189047F3|nr:TetR/AcrR family transcriptional regulator [Nocardia sp. BSTN01]MBF4997243.1 TetR/AcrR family transcriptional regulator [Nocardia sp. BSTN01]